jgi:ArsR family transcriptional regulator, arsenate/arsenite/antimonite-responsive transcriptional repressor
MSKPAEISGAKPHLKKWSVQVAALLKACADPTRVRLLNLLAHEGEICVCHLADVLGANQPKVSRHLAYLKRVGLVSDRRDGLWVHYQVSPKLGDHASRLIACLNSCAAEVTEMRDDIDTLRRIKIIQPPVKLARQPRLTTAEPGPQEQDRPVSRYGQEIQVELL